MAPAEYGTHLGRIGLGVAAEQLVEVSTGEPESGGIEGQLVHRARLHSPNRAGGRRGQFVESVVAVHHQHAGTARGEHSGHHLGEVGERTADQTGPR